MINEGDLKEEINLLIEKWDEIARSYRETAENEDDLGAYIARGFDRKIDDAKLMLWVIDNIPKIKEFKLFGFYIRRGK